MLVGIVITIREGLEAFLVIAILIGYLRKLGESRRSWQIWLGAVLAIVTSVLVALGLNAFSLSLSERSSELFEIVASLLAVGVLSWMVLWMQRQSVAIKGELESRVDAALSGGQLLALASLAYVTIVREGIETALFLTALSKSAKNSLFTGAVLGLIIAALLTYLIFKGAVRLSLRKFFIATSVMLILIAAGLIGHATMGLAELGMIRGPLAQVVWDTSRAIPDTSLAGKLLHVFTGYVARPILSQVVVYVTYIALFTVPYRRSVVETRRKPRNA